MALSDNDKKRALTEHCKMKGDMIVNPIIDWRDCDVWEFYWGECKLHNPVYKMGYTRVGCIGCPMAGKGRWKEFHDWPTYKRAYIRAFGKMLEVIQAAGKPTKWRDGEDVFAWWIEDYTIPGQMNIEDFLEV